MTQHFQPAGTFSLLSRYQHIIRQQQALLAQIKTVLPETLAEHVQHCTVSGKKLLLFTASSSWSSQLRFYHQAILQKAVEAGWPQLQLMQVKVVPPRIESQSTRKPNVPSVENIKLIQHAAEAQSDTRLKQALARLGDTLTKKRT